MRKILLFILVSACIAVLVYALAGHWMQAGVVRMTVAVGAGLIVGYPVRNRVAGFSLSQFVLVGGFLVFITIPLLGPMEDSSFEKRALAPFPEWRWSNVWKFFSGYKNYFEDHFAYRNEMVEKINKFKLAVFRKSSVPNLVSVGKNNWLYLARADYIGAISKPYTEAQLDTVVWNLRLISGYFEARGIAYYFMMLPVKERIYPEYETPMHRLETSFSRKSQLLTRLKDYPELKVVDCERELIDGKKVRDTYYNTDTHWNMYGSFLAYRKLMEAIHRDDSTLQAEPITSFKIDSLRETAGDLLEMMGMKDMIERTRYTIAWRTKLPSTNTTFTSAAWPDLIFGVKENEGAEKTKKLFLVRDSFSEYLKYFLVPHFKRAVLAWTPRVPVPVIVEEKPDIVVHEIQEMFSGELLAPPQAILADTAFMKQFRLHSKNQ